MITDTPSLIDFLAKPQPGSFVTIDTEFLRDRTYYPRLCLIQIAGPGIDAVAIDPLANGLDLSPLYNLLADDRIVKVFHAARQDLEIFYNLTGTIPRPLFDTQVAAMVCGYGDQIGYNTLVSDVLGKTLDKGAQFTDWSRRPLSDRQLSYALDDVIHLRDVYLHLKKKLEKLGRTEWVDEEMGVLTAPSTYENNPEESWKRIKLKTVSPRVLAVLREIAAWREREAQRRDVPRPRILRDETLADIAVHPPKTESELRSIRNLPDDAVRGAAAQGLLDAVKKGLSTPSGECPQPDIRSRFPQDMTPVLEMLKMLLRIQASQHGVAARLIISGEDLEQLAVQNDADIPALKGWRYEVFGKEALALKNGKTALSLKNGRIHKQPIM